MKEGKDDNWRKSQEEVWSQMLGMPRDFSQWHLKQVTLSSWTAGTKKIFCWTLPDQQWLPCKVETFEHSAAGGNKWTYEIIHEIIEYLELEKTSYESTPNFFQEERTLPFFQDYLEHMKSFNLVDF